MSKVVTKVKEEEKVAVKVSSPKELSNSLRKIYDLKVLHFHKEHYLRKNLLFWAYCTGQIYQQKLKKQLQIQKKWFEKWYDIFQLSLPLNQHIVAKNTDLDKLKSLGLSNNTLPMHQQITTTNDLVALQDIQTIAKQNIIPWHEILDHLSSKIFSCRSIFY